MRNEQVRTHWTPEGGSFSHRPGFLTAWLSLPFKVRLYSHGRLSRHPQNCYSAVQAQPFSPTDSDSCSAGTLDLHFEASSRGHLLFLTQTTFWEKQMGRGVFWSLHLLPFQKVLHQLSPLISACDHSEGSALGRKEASLSAFHQEDSYVFNHRWMEKTPCPFHMNYFVHFLGSAHVWINITSLRHRGACSIDNWHHSFKLHVFFKKNHLHHVPP